MKESNRHPDAAGRPPGAASARAERADELRCHCGSLIARLVDGKLELKCRRCQRVGLMDLAALPSAAVEIRWSEDVTRTRLK